MMSAEHETLDQGKGEELPSRGRPWRCGRPVSFRTRARRPSGGCWVARLLTKTLPRVTAIELEGVGHMGPVTHADRVNALTERYLTDGPNTSTE